MARWPAFVGSSVLAEMVLHTLAEVLLCAAAETLGRLSDEGRFHGSAEDGTSAHDAGS
jgi:hypothetical protein